jgi:flagellar biosynthesis/type III secretory pathway protein FliH
MGYQLRNKTSGGQDEGKIQIADYKPAKGYRDGLKQGYKNAQRDIRKLFDKWLTVEYDKTKKLAERAYQKFNEFIKEEQSK